MHTIYLTLEDCSVWQGIGFGSNAEISGEVVFTTGMIGYPESLTDPSYKGQVVVFTYPLIGNYGAPNLAKKENLYEYLESSQIHVSGIVVSSYVDSYAHWNAISSLDAWLKKEKVPGIFGIDTRALTQKLREKGVMLGKISTTPDTKETFHDPNTDNLVAQVSIKKPAMYGSGPKTVLLLDCGVKHGIIFELLKLGVRVYRVPWDFDMATCPITIDAVVVSNGPGDPIQATASTKAVFYCLQNSIPTLGICLGHQILALAAGGKTFKLKYGHRSHNQPALDLTTGRAYMTTQNHGFCVDMQSLGNDWKEWFVNLNDNTNEGLQHRTKLFWSVQFHPEGRPGPYDTSWIFKDFIKAVDKK